jgi:hypothetical protein
MCLPLPSAEQYSTNSMELGPRNQHLLCEPRNSPRFEETERSSLFESICHRSSIICHIQPVHHNINFNSILSCVPRSSKCPICPRFATKSLYAFLYFTMRATCPASLNRFCFTILITFSITTNQPTVAHRPYCRKATVFQTLASRDIAARVSRFESHNSSKQHLKIRVPTSQKMQRISTMTYKITGFHNANDTRHCSDVLDGTLIAFPHPHFFIPARSTIFYLGRGGGVGC